MKSVLTWKVGYCNSENSRPDEFFSATVPGAVQLDYAKEYNLPDYREGLNFKEYQWMQDKFWVYKTTYSANNLPENANLFLVSKGIDYKSDIYVNGKLLSSYEGMYRTQKLNLNEFKNSDLNIEVVIYPMPKSDLPNVHPNCRDEANQSTKPAVSYGWDFHPRLVPLGIWDEIYIEVTEHSPIEPKVTYTINDDRTNAVVSMEANCTGEVNWTLTDPEGNEIFAASGNQQCFAVENPKLWWCVGYGEPNLYKWELEVKNLGVSEFYRGTIGFKTVSLEMNKGSWEEPIIFPMSRNSPPATVTLNGVPIFAKGTNWVAPEIFYATANKTRYEELLTLIKKANLNIIRCWGGANVNKDFFYDICDELGIMVWQEFPLGCNNYVATKKYMSVLENEANDIIDRVSKHACHIIWCGGNELFNSWSRMTDQSMALRFLNKLTFEKTPDIPYIATSPLMNMAHGCYRFLYDDGREVLQVMPEANKTAYPEFGIPALSNLDTLKTIANLDELFPLEENELTLSHHAFKAWGADSWACLPTVEKYFGHADSLEELVENSQFLQKVGYNYIFEEARRQKPYCSIAINWCFDEPWPCIANNSVIGYPNSIKGGYYGIVAAARNVVASARQRKFVYKAGEVFDFDLYLLNDGLQKVEDGEIKAYIQIGDGEKKHLITWEYKDVKVNTNVEGPTVRTVLEDVQGENRMKLILECGEYSSEYDFIYIPTERKVSGPRKLNG